MSQLPTPITKEDTAKENRKSILVKKKKKKKTQKKYIQIN